MAKVYTLCARQPGTFCKMATLLYDDQLDIYALHGRPVAIIGYGSQGRAQALCLRDRGAQVFIGVRPGASYHRAEEDDWAPLPIAQATREASVVALLVPDSAQKGLFEIEIAPNLQPGAALILAHGFNLLYEQVVAPAGHDVILVAPMGAGPGMRALFEQGRGVPGLVAIHRDSSGTARELALAYAMALGCGRAGVIESTVREEVETDLFGEQAVLCGGLAALAMAGFDTLVEAGYPEELAYFECVHQIKLLADLIHDHGIRGMRERISDTALFGDLTRGPRVIGEPTRGAMKQVLEEIRDGRFAAEWLAEQERGRPKLSEAANASARIDAVADRLRRNPP